MSGYRRAHISWGVKLWSYVLIRHRDVLVVDTTWTSSVPPSQLDWKGVAASLLRRERALSLLAGRSVFLFHSIPNTKQYKCDVRRNRPIKHGFWLVDLFG